MMEKLSGGVLSVAGICAIAALCEQTMDNSRYFKLVRMVLGLEIARILISSVAAVDGFIQ